MKKIALCITFIVGLFGLMHIGCASGNQYDNGYEAAWEGKNKPSSFWASDDEKEGYEQGQNDAWLYDEGYYDGANDKRPKHPNDPSYMDGFKDGKR